MNKTTNYQLNQWERSDKVQMEDFNADNAKIDAAIRAVDAKADGKAAQTALNALTARVAAEEAANPRVKLLDMTTTGQSARLDVDLSRFDLSQYLRLDIYAHKLLTSEKAINIMVALNGREEKIYSSRSPGSSAYMNEHISGFSSFDQADNGVYTASALFTLDLYGGVIHGEALPLSVRTYNSDHTAYHDRHYWGVYPSYMKLDQLRSINFISPLPILPGSRVVVYGIKV